jgi:hypothetical protein
VGSDRRGLWGVLVLLILIVLVTAFVAGLLAHEEGKLTDSAVLIVVALYGVLVVLVEVRQPHTHAQRSAIAEALRFRCTALGRTRAVCNTSWRRRTSCNSSWPIL